MFVYSVKGNTLKLVGVLCLAAVLVFSLLLLIPNKTKDLTAASQSAESGEPTAKEVKINYNKIRTNEDRIAFLAQFGWKVESETLEEATVRIPKTFDKILASYNELQTKQGLDLSKYAGKEVTRYTYKVTNYPDYTGEVRANLIICKNRVIGGDICSSDIDGFIRGFEYPGEVPECTDETQPQADSTAADTTAADGTDSAALTPDSSVPEESAADSE